jgi:hypothetical protein
MGASASQNGLSQAEPCSTVSALTGFDPSRSDEWRKGYAAGCAWYADYIQRVAAIQNRPYWERTHGDAGDALDFACDHCGPEEALAFLEDWRAGLADEWPGFMRWLKVQQDGAKASAIEARRAATGNTDAVEDESAASEAGDAK